MGADLSAERTVRPVNANPVWPLQREALPDADDSRHREGFEAQFPREPRRRAPGRRGQTAGPVERHPRPSRMTRIALSLATLALLAATAPAMAARPFVTDDARLTTAGSCQLESWARIYPDSREFWALPACNPGGNFEITAGGGVAKFDGESSTTDYVFQGKTLFRAMEPNDWGIGLAAGTILHPDINPGPNQLGNVYAYVPISKSFADDTVVVHLNLGWLHDRDSSKERATWGVGGEFQLTPRLLGIAETFGDSQPNSYWQAGVRYAIIPGLFQVDATVGARYGGDSDSRWVSFGIRLTPDRLF
jgi:hypothetical protein